QCTRSEVRCGQTLPAKASWHPLPGQLSRQDLQLAVQQPTRSNPPFRNSVAAEGQLLPRDAGLAGRSNRVRGIELLVPALYSRSRRRSLNSNGVKGLPRLSYSRLPVLIRC